MTHTQEFETHRPLLFAIAYRMLGSAMEAEDMVQETYVRWISTPLERVQHARAFLTTVITRLCIDALRSARAKREVYFGTWLPEPLYTSDMNPENKLLHEESVSFAFLLLLEQLSPDERAAFLLREVFDYDYPEIASILGKQPDACRQLLHRARKRVQEGRKRFSVSYPKRDAIVQEFMRACAVGDIESLLAVLAGDVTLVSDGGGKVPAAVNDIRGSGNVARFFVGLAKKATPQMRVFFTSLNAMPALLVLHDEELQTAFLLDTDGDRIADIYSVRNPDKLQWLAGEIRGGKMG